MAIDLNDGTTATAEDLGSLAMTLRETQPPADVAWAALMTCAFALEALAATKDDMAELRKEFEALKSSIRHGDR